MKKYELVKCSNPNCNEQFRISVIEFPFVNDYGWIELECNRCGAKTKVEVKNPTEHSRCGFYPNATLINYHEYDEDEPHLDIDNECVSVVEEKKDGVKWNPLVEEPFWKVGQHDEVKFKSDFEKSKKLIEQGISLFFNAYLAGQRDLPEKIIVVQHVSRYKLTWAKTAKKERDYNVDNLYLINHNKYKEWPDGVYNRDTILKYLERCLMRWKLLSKQVVIVTPFIGFQYENLKYKENVLGLWEFLNDRLDMKKTNFVTRSGTKTLLKKSQNDIDIPFDELKKWELMSELQKNVEEKKIKTKGTFHAKFYAGIFENHVEMLSGSYNVHTGRGLEQITMSRYPLEAFKEKYMDKLVPDFSYLDSTDEDVLFVEVNSKEVLYSDTRKLSDVIKIMN